MKSVWDEICQQWDEICQQWDEICQQWDEICQQWDEICLGRDLSFPFVGRNLPHSFKSSILPCVERQEKLHSGRSELRGV